MASYGYVGDAWRAGLILWTPLFLGEDGGRGRGCGEPVCHLDFATKVPDLCWVADKALQFLESEGSEAVKDIRQEIRDLKAKAAVGVSLQRAIKVVMKQNKTNEGSRTWQTLLTAAAFCRPANDDEEEGKEEDEKEAMSMSSRRK